jgi:hypothetical protein
MCGGCRSSAWKRRTSGLPLERNRGPWGGPPPARRPDELSSSPDPAISRASANQTRVARPAGSAAQRKESAIGSCASGTAPETRAEAAPLCNAAISGGG